MGFSLSRLPWLRRWFGDRSELAAERFLKRRGFRILRRNYLCPPGELDLIALDGDVVVFVEVRSTSILDGERATLSIDLAKQRHLTQAALHFLQRSRLRDPVCRFDVVIVIWQSKTNTPQFRYFPQAFEAVGRFQLDH